MLAPLISIIVPVYNVESYLSYCLDSLLAQTYTHLEILLIDDGSEDDSLKICKAYAEKDNRIKVFHHENHGLGYTRNFGLANVTGEYISFIDSDDYVDKTFIENLYTNIIKGDYDFSMVDYQPTYNHEFKDVKFQNKIVEFSQKHLFNYLYNGPLKSVDQLDDILFIMVTNKLYKKQLLDGITFPSYFLSEDLFFNNLVFLRTQKAVFTHVKLYYYLQRTDSVTHVINHKFIQGLQAYFGSLRNIPVNQKEYRAACLMKLYKIILSTRYLMRNISEDQDINNIIKDIKSQTISEMIQSKSIPLSMKLLFILFYQVPFFYVVFMRLSEFRAKASEYHFFI